MAPKPPRSKLNRLARLGSLTSRVSGSYVGQRVKGIFQDPDGRDAALNRLHLANAERIVDTMGALKGAAMKVGQSLAIALDGVDLPPEVSRILGRLHDSAAPIPFEEIRKTVESELGQSLEDLFLDFDPEPLGAASLAQAHAARLKDGTPVVVKALYDGIEQSVDSDLGALRSMLVTGRVLRRDPKEVTAIFTEIRTRLMEELDYYQEAANLESFRASLADMDGVHIPRTHPTLSSARVLTMDRLTGASADVFAAQATPEAKQRAGDLLVKSFYRMIYKMRALHADPHGGNYLFQNDGSIGIIDFGCVKRFDPYWIADYARLALAFLDDQPQAAMDYCRRIGVLHSHDSESERVLWELGQTMAIPLHADHYTCGASKDSVTARLAQIMPQVLRHSDLRSPPELVYLHRSLGGTYALLRKLGHGYNYGDLFRSHAAHAIGVAEGTIKDQAVPLPVG